VLTPQEEHTLRLIELCTSIDDERFADSLRDGRPREPREYRRRRRWRLTAVLPVVAGGVFAHNHLVVTAVLMIIAVALACLGWFLPR